MRTVSQFFSNQLTSAIALGHSWKVYVQFDPSNDLWTELDVNQLDRIGWELEKDWSVFISGDVSFQVYDPDSAIRNLIGNNPCKVKIYANYSDYSHNDSCLVFCGYIKPSETIIENDFVTYYCQSPLSYLDNAELFPFYGRITEDNYFTTVIPMRNVLQIDYDLTQICDFDNCQLWAFNRKIVNCFLTHCISPTLIYDRDVIFENETDYDYENILVNVAGSSAIKVYRINISKNDTSEIKEKELLYTIGTGFGIATADSIRIFKSSSTEFDYLIFVKRDNGKLGAIIKIADEHYTVHSFYSSQLKITWESISLSPDGTYVCGFSALDSSSTRTMVRIDTASMTVVNSYSIGGWNDIDLFSGELSKDSSTYYYGFIYKSSVNYYVTIYSFTTGAGNPSAVLSADEISSLADRHIVATGRYFFWAGKITGSNKTLHYNVNNGTRTDLNINYVYARLGSEYFTGTNKSVYLLDYNAKHYFIYRMSELSADLDLIQESDIDNFNDTAYYAYFTSNFYKFRTLKEKLYPDGMIAVYLPVVFPTGMGKGYYFMATEKCPFLIDFGAGGFGYNGTSQIISIKEALCQMFGAYFTAMSITDWTEEDKIQVRCQPRVGDPKIIYDISLDSIINDSMKLIPNKSYRIVVQSQSQEKYSGSGEDYDFNYDCLPTSLLQDIADYLLTQFAETVIVQFQGNSLFHCELADWIRLDVNGTDYIGIITKNEIGFDGMCDVEVYAKVEA